MSTSYPYSAGKRVVGSPGPAQVGSARGSIVRARALTRRYLVQDGWNLFSGVRWFVRGGWYPLVIVMSFGIFSFVPFVHAALHRPTWVTRSCAALYTTAVITLFLVPTVRHIGGGGMLIGFTIVATIHSIVLRRCVWPRSAASPAAEAGTHVVGPVTEPVVAEVWRHRARRDEARRLAASDPRMARELRIGRPDLVRDYDDGGLVDLNSAEAPVIAETCGIDLQVASQIVEAREQVLFFDVEDVFAFVEVPFAHWDRVRDYAVVVTG